MTGIELRSALVAQMSPTATNNDRAASYRTLDTFKQMRASEQVTLIGQLSSDGDETIKHAAKGLLLDLVRASWGAVVIVIVLRKHFFCII